jgi:hypothetical protein
MSTKKKTETVVHDASTFPITKSVGIELNNCELTLSMRNNSVQDDTLELAFSDDQSPLFTGVDILGLREFLNTYLDDDGNLKL